MNLRQKLDLLSPGSAASAPPPGSEEPKAFPTLERALGGGELENERGRFFARQERLPDHLCHGPRPLEHARWLSRALLARSQTGILSLDPQTALYLDTETTGLSGGSGTYAFLVGLGWFEDGCFVIEQLLMRDHSEEKALLEHLGQRLQRCSGLITFNGKTFDGPLLQTRFVMNRLAYDLEDLPHLDLLYVGRRLWADVLESCKLETLETELLGLPRQNDVPGWLVPQIYFRFLQDSDPRGLRRVVEHNRRDLLAMVGLVSGLRHYFDAPLENAGSMLSCPQQQARECAAFGRWMLHLRQFELAEAMLEKAFGALPPGPQFRKTGSLLARLRQRAGQSEAAFELWKRLLEADPRDVRALEEVAKIFEHGKRDYAAALDHVGRALAEKDLRAAWRKRLLHRHSRLASKQSALK